MSLSIKYFVYFITIQMYHHPSSITMYHHLSPFIHCALIKSHRASHFWRLQSHKQITVQELLKSHYITLFRSPFPLTLWLFYIPIGSMYGIYANIGGILMVNVTIYSIHGSYGIYNIVMENDRVIQEKNRCFLHIFSRVFFLLHYVRDSQLRGESTTVCYPQVNNINRQRLHCCFRTLYGQEPSPAWFNGGS